MAASRHKLVVDKTPLHRRLRIVVPVALATAVTGTCVGSAVAWSGSGSSPVATTEPSASAKPFPSIAQDRTQAVSRSAERTVLKPKPKPKPEPVAKPKPEPVAKPKPEPVAKPKLVTFTAGPVSGERFMTTALNVWTGPGEDYTLLDVLSTGTKVDITGRDLNGYAEIVLDGESRWVNADYLSENAPEEDEPEEETAARTTTSGAACAAGSSIESGITANAVALYRAVCAQFPQVTSYGGWRGDGEHVSGQAIDIMVSGTLGQQIADWLQTNYQALQVNDIIWSQRIWTVQRSSEGWRYMEDRGSTTANHYDHVHVQVF